MNDVLYKRVDKLCESNWKVKKLIKEAGSFNKCNKNIQNLIIQEINKKDKFFIPKTMNEVNLKHKIMTTAENYQLNLSGCETVGINGGCGLGCPILKNGECNNEEMNDKYDEINKDKEW